jgi:two-component system chemotaxis response regulator CheY
MTPQTHHSIPSMVPPANCFSVLVIDDMVQNRILLGKVLKSAGYAVIEATNGAEAMEMIAAQNLAPDLIVTDIEMPVMDGITFVSEIRGTENPVSGTPVIAASGNADDTMRREAIAAGADLFLSKPFDLIELRREIAALLKSRRRSAAPRFEANRIESTLNRIERVDLPVTEPSSNPGA